MANELAVAQGFVRSLFAEAQSNLGTVPAGYAGDDNLKAMLGREALAITSEQTKTILSAQMLIVTELSKDRLWLAHPPTEDYPDGYESLADLLKDAGFVTGKGQLTSTGSYLRSIGEEIVPYCDRKGIALGDCMTNSTRPKLLYAIAAIKKAIRDDDAEGVEQVLADVRGFASREAIAAKYHEPRSRDGHGTTVRLKKNRTVMILVLDDDDAVEKILRRVGGVVEWGLPAQASESGGLIKLDVYDETHDLD